MDSASSNTVDTVRCRHFSASLARAASARCPLFSASTPRIRRTGTSSLFASCTTTSAILRGSPSETTSWVCRTFRFAPTDASYSGRSSGAFCLARRAQLVLMPPGSRLYILTPKGAISIRESVAEAADSPFRRVVRRIAGNCQAAPDGRHLKDIAALLSAHHRDRGASGVHYAI